LGVKQRLITFSNEFQFESLKVDFIPLEISFQHNIEGDVTFENVENVKLNSHYGILVSSFGK
jgi:hypothetical protein